MSTTDTSTRSGSDTSEESEDELNIDFDHLCDEGGFAVPFLQSFLSIFSSHLLLKIYIDRAVGWHNYILSPTSLVYSQRVLFSSIDQFCILLGTWWA